MSINRQFSLPNCVLILEGLSNTPEGSGVARPELSILTRFECFFAREKQALVGGLDLLQSLITATNDCVQASISGVPSAHHQGRKESALKVEIQPLNGLYELTVPSDLLSQSTHESSKEGEEQGIQLQISAVQLFDLMEAIDQLAADQQTLPSLKTSIRSRTRQETLSGSLLVEKSAPVALGTASVAAAAAALFFMPIPKVPTPKETQPAPGLIQPSAVPSTAAPPRNLSSPAPTQPKPSP